MTVLYNVIILILIVGAFLSGKTISDRYHQKILHEYDYILRVHAAERGVGYVAPPAKNVPIGQPFMDRLRQNGRATQRLKRS